MIPTAVLMRRFLLFAFGLLYNSLAWTYDLVSWTVSAGQWRSWQRAALPYLRGRLALEIAHGTGNLLLDLVSLGFQPIGLDLSPAMGRIASRKLKRRLGQTELPVPLVRASVAAMPFPAETFPSLVSTFPAEFFVQSPVISEYFRVLQPGGVLVCVPAAQITSLRLFDRWAAWLFRATGQASSGAFDPVVSLYAAAGFRARVEMVRQPRSLVFVIIAEKPPRA
jgi:ubiquinone/menaquinone biosynthesis C-methylase UbiE